MTTSDDSSFADLITRLRATSPDSDFNPRYSEAQSLAASHGLIVYPAVPDSGDSVAVNDSQMSLTDFIATAAKLNAGLLYCTLDRFTSWMSIGLEDEYDGNQLAQARAAELTAATQHLEGAPVGVRVGFPHAGIVHVWELFADWDAQIAAAVGHIDAAFRES